MLTKFNQNFYTLLALRCGNFILMIAILILLSIGGQLTRGKSPYWKILISLVSITAITISFPIDKAIKELEEDQLVNEEISKIAHRKLLEKYYELPTTTAPIKQIESSIDNTWIAPVLPVGTDDATKHAIAILQTCHKKEYAPSLIKTQTTPTVHRLFFDFNLPEDETRFKTLNLQRLTGASDKPRLFTQDGCLCVEIARNDRQFPNYQEFIKELTPVSPIAVTLGVDGEGKLVRSRIKDAVHFLGGGTTGSGKSKSIQSLLFSLIYPYSPNEVKLIINDPKKVTFPKKLWSKVPHLEGEITSTLEDLIKVLNNVYKISQYRYQLLEENECENIYEYNEKFSDKLPLYFVVCDEIAQYVNGKKLDKKLDEILSKTAAYVRAAGICLIIFTQKPHGDILSTNIKANLPSGIGLKTKNNIESQLIINDVGCENLLGKGDCLFCENGENSIRLQFPEFTNEMLDLVFKKWGVNI